MRLIKVYDIYGLTPTEIEAFKESLWAQTDQNTKLPANTGVYNFVFLQLPEPNKGCVSDNYRAWLTSQQIPSNIARIVDTNGKIRYSQHSSLELDNFIQEWLYSSSPLQFEKSKEGEKKIEWSDKEIITLFHKIDLIWNERKSWLSERKEINDSFYQELLEEFERILYLFEQIIVLKLDKLKESKEIDPVLKTLDEFSQYGLCINAAIPGILLVKPEEYVHISEELIKGMESLSEETTKKSFDGFYNYGLLAFHKKIPPVKSELVSCFAYCISLWKEPGLSYAIRIASELIKNYPDIFTKQHINDFVYFLENLVQREKRKEMKIEVSLQEEPFRVSDTESEAVQQYAIDLAMALHKYFTQTGEPIPDIITEYVDKKRVAQ